jgi:hypothetical protein
MGMEGYAEEHSTNGRNIRSMFSLVLLSIILFQLSDESLIHPSASIAPDPTTVLSFSPPWSSRTFSYDTRNRTVSLFLIKRYLDSKG